jgi:hypothetical protein
VPKRGRYWRHLCGINLLDCEFELLKIPGWGPNFIRCSRTTPSSFSRLYRFVNLNKRADKKHIMSEAAMSKQPETALE